MSTFVERSGTEGASQTNPSDANLAEAILGADLKRVDTSEISHEPFSLGRRSGKYL